MKLIGILTLKKNKTGRFKRTPRMLYVSGDVITTSGYLLIIIISSFLTPQRFARDYTF